MPQDPKDVFRGGRSRPSLVDVLRLILAPDGKVDVRHTDDWCGKGVTRSGTTGAPRIPGPRSR